ncbi:MAG: arginine deiminase family protein [Bacteroidales bacterium]|nr:arginine deiminase family protein [Bacteroidales bacterium]MDZ4204073.1 arginine deiminase family protein [Bacteroidales bacterium]
MIRSEGDRLTKVIVCSPRNEYFRANDLSAHNITALAERRLAIGQHTFLKNTIRSFGCEVIDLPELTDHPNSVFTRDTTLCTSTGYIRLRMGLTTRTGEEAWMAKALQSLGIEEVASIEAPATVEGGNIILAGEVAFIGQSSRTNAAGVQQVSKILEIMGYEVRSAIVPPPFLHIGGAMSLVGSGHILCCSGIFSGGFFDGFHTTEIPNKMFISGNVINLGNNTVIADIANQRAVLALEQAGIHVLTLDLSEFVKGTGGPSCLILPVDREV